VAPLAGGDFRFEGKRFPSPDGNVLRRALTGGTHSELGHGPIRPPMDPYRISIAPNRRPMDPYRASNGIQSAADGFQSLAARSQSAIHGLQWRFHRSQRES